MPRRRDRTEARMPKLTETHLVILSSAARRNGAVLPLPKSLDVEESATATALKTLVKRGLLAERPAANGEDCWREREDGRRVTLGITAAGVDAIGVDPGEVPGAIESATDAPRPSSRTKATAKNGRRTRRAKEPDKPVTKQARLIDLLRRKQGATVAEIGEATGWQAHSVRGAISGLVRKKLGLTVVSEVVEGRGRVYRTAKGL